jgi:hypothetical protein
MRLRPDRQSAPMPFARQPRIVDRSVRQPGRKGVVGQSLDMVDEVPTMNDLDRRQRARVEIAPAPGDQARVTHFVNQRMSEGNLAIGESFRHFEEVRGLKPLDRCLQLLIVELLHRLQNVGRKLFA